MTLVAGDAVLDVLRDDRLLWFLNRGSGIVLMALLTLSVAFGVAATARTSSRRWPRFVTQGVHRNVSLMAVVLLVLHPATAVIDGYVDIRWYDALLPVGSAYKPFWLGLGSLALDLTLVVVASSLVRRRLRHRAWRALHLTGYAAWVLGVVHGLGIGTDARQTWSIAITLACIGIVAAAAVIRTSTLAQERRLAARTGDRSDTAGDGTLGQRADPPRSRV